MHRDEDDRRAIERGELKRREAPRQRCLLAGLLVRPGADHLQRVGVRNLSPTGAKLVLEGLGIVYADTVLVIPKLEAAWAIEVVWRELPEAGVRFTRSCALEADPQIRLMVRAAAA